VSEPRGGRRKGLNSKPNDADQKAGRRGPTLKTIQRVIAKNCTLSQYGTLIAIALAERVNRQGEAWPSLRSLMACTRMTRSTVVRSLTEITECDPPLFYKSWARSKAAKRKSLTYVFVDSEPCSPRARKRGVMPNCQDAPQHEHRALPEHGNGEMPAQSTGMLSLSTDDAPPEHDACSGGARVVLSLSNNPPIESPNEPEREPTRAREDALARVSPSGMGNGNPETEPERVGVHALTPPVTRRPAGRDLDALRDGVRRLREAAASRKAP
jgi:hypothetical protein